MLHAKLALKSLQEFIKGKRKNIKLKDIRKKITSTGGRETRREGRKEGRKEGRSSSKMPRRFYLIYI